MKPTLATATVLTAIRTPYQTSGTVDVSTYDRLVEAQIAAGVEGLVVGGTTGDGHLLEWDEHLALIAHTVRHFGDRLVVIGNTGGNVTSKAVRHATQGFEVGMDAALNVTPYYGMTSEEGVLAHFNAILGLGPVIVYNVPKRAPDIPPAIMSVLAEHPNMVGIKECAGSERIAGYQARGIRCWSGNDRDAFVSRYDAHSAGVISVASNLVPSLIVAALRNHDADAWAQVDLLLNWLDNGPNPIPLATAMAMTGAIAPVFRLPYVPLQRDLRKAGLDVFDRLPQNAVIGDKREVLEDDDFTIL